MRKVLFIAPVAFAGLHQRHQSLAVELAKSGWQVTYVDPLKTGGFSCKVAKVNDHLNVIELRVPFKGASHPYLQRFSSRFAMLLLRMKLKIVPDSALLWVGEPSLAWLSRHKWQAVIYDRCDLHGAFPGQKRQVWQDYEEILFATATLVSCSHEYLQQGLAADILKKSVLAGNASDDIFFAQRQPQRISKQKIRLVSSGAHYEWVDSRWLSMLCDHADIELHLAGSGRGRDYENLRQRVEVIDHGRLNRPDLAELLKSCDVGLVAFKDLELIKGVDPVKVYEYTASGLETWATDVKNLHKNPLVTRFISNRHELDKAVAAIKLRAIPLAGQAARWNTRLQTILDRLTYLQSD